MTMTKAGWDLHCDCGSEDSPVQVLFVALAEKLAAFDTFEYREQRLFLGIFLGKIKLDGRVKVFKGGIRVGIIHFYPIRPRPFLAKGWKTLAHTDQLPTS